MNLKTPNRYSFLVGLVLVLICLASLVSCSLDDLESRVRRLEKDKGVTIFRDTIQSDSGIYIIERRIRPIKRK